MKIQLHQVLASETLSSIARQYEVSTRQLRNLNGKTKAQLSPGETLFIKVVEDEVLFEEAFQARGLGDEETFIIHEVQPKETIYQIAKKYGISEGDLKRSNDLTSNIIGIGAKLRIYRNQKPPTTITDSNIGYHVVQPKETFFSIAPKYKITPSSLQVMNPNVNPKTLAIGSKLVIGVLNYPSPSPSKPIEKPSQPNPVVKPDHVLPNQQDLPPGPYSFQVEDQYINGKGRHILSFSTGRGSVIKAVFIEAMHQGQQGLSYGGQYKQVPSQEQLSLIGISPGIVRILMYTSMHEGNFDAINAFDAGIFSFGFIQFTGASRNLDKVLQSMATHSNDRFRSYFEPYGIGVQNNTLQILTQERSMLTGQEAWKYIRNSFPQLYIPFILAGNDPLLVLDQWRVANTEFVAPVLNLQLQINTIDGQIQRHILSQTFPGEDIHMMAVSLAINLGVNGFKRLFEQTLSRLAQQHNLMYNGTFPFWSTREVGDCMLQLVNEPGSRWDPGQRKRIGDRVKNVLSGV